MASNLVEINNTSLGGETPTPTAAFEKDAAVVDTAKDIDASSSTCSDTEIMSSGSSGSDSEETANHKPIQPFVEVKDSFPTGLKRRRGSPPTKGEALWSESASELASKFFSDTNYHKRGTATPTTKHKPLPAKDNGLTLSSSSSASELVSNPSLMSDDDPTARADPSRSKYLRTAPTKTCTTTTTATNATAMCKIVDGGQPYTPARWLEFAAGCFFFFVPIPFVIGQIVCCNVWELLDQATFRVTNKLETANEWCGRQLTIYKKLVEHPEDTFIVNLTIWLGIILPSYFFVEAFAQAKSLADGNGFIWWRAVLYNVVRIGPMYRNFMFAYVLCHKEAHTFGKLFAMPYRKYLGLQFVYNYFIGFFHGVLPGPFTVSHIYNHHKYDNDSDDIYSTGAYPRDSFKQYLRYVYVWFLYALNVSSIRKFREEKQHDKALHCIAGTLYYLVCIGLCGWYVSPLFAVVYVFYPLVESNILLSAVNYTWHAFIDPNDHDNDYVNSTTILDAMNFTLDEEYHVVHHQYSGVHWSRNKELYEKHIEDYKKCTATVFKGTNIFVVWGMVVARDYEGLCDHFHQYEEDESKRLSRDELMDLLKVRLRCTTWSY